MRLRDERLAVVADVAEILDDVGEILAVVQRLPFTETGEAPHVRGRATFVLGTECHLVGPCTGLRAVGAPLAVDLVGHHVLANQARHHARPAPVWVLVVDVLEGDRLVLAGVGEAVVVLPPLAELVVPTGILLLEPFEVGVGHGVDAPVVDRPAGGEEAGDLVHVVLVDDAVPRLLDQVVRNRQTVLLQWQKVTAVVVVVDPAAPHLGVGLAVLAAVLGPVLDEGADRGVDDAVVVPPRVAQIPFQQWTIALVGQCHQQDRVTV